MAYTETTSKGWFQRIRESFGGIVTGFVLIIIATCLLWWNEERTFKTAGAIGEAELVAQDVQDISKIDSSLEGKVIHASGHADTKDILNDPVFGVNFNAIRLEREAEFYQWREHSHSETRKKLGGGEETITTYTYDKGWTDEPVDSYSFHDSSYRDKNITLAKVEDQSFWANTVTFGAYTLPNFLKHQISGAVPLNIERVNTSSVMSLMGLPEGYQADEFIHVSGNTVYLGRNPSSPSIGDVRITFKQTPPADVSIIAQVIRNTFEQFRASNGYTFSRLDMGIKSSSLMFEGARSDNNIMAWVLRVIGIICAVLGLRMIFKPLSVLGDVIPIVGTIIGAGTGIIALLLGLAWSLVVIAVAWVRFRPLIAGGLIAAAVVLVTLSYIKGRKASE